MWKDQLKNKLIELSEQEEITAGKIRKAIFFEDTSHVGIEEVYRHAFVVCDKEKLLNIKAALISSLPKHPLAEKAWLKSLGFSAEICKEFIGGEV